MITKNVRLLFSLFVCIVCVLPTFGQVVLKDSTAKRVDIIEAERMNVQTIEGVGGFTSLAGHVQLRQDKTLFYCDSAVLNQSQNIFEAFGNIHINDADSVHTYSKYLKYLGKEKIAYLKNNVKLTDNKAVLTTNELEYNTITKTGTYTKGGKVVDGKTVLTSTEGIYYGETRDIYFKKKVVLIDPEYRLTTDTLLYNTYTELARFTVPTKIITGGRTIKTSEGFYDMHNRKAVFGRRPFIEDSTSTTEANDIAFDLASGFGEAQGNVVYKNKDTANAFAVLANNIKTNRNTGALLATQKPLLIIKQNGDSLYVTADTLFTGKLTELRKSRNVPDIDFDSTLKVTPHSDKDSSRNRYFEAYFNVKIFSDSLQAVGDSLFYSFEDSAFRLFKNPIVWAQGNQLTGDTIYLYSKNKKPGKLYVFENAVAINRVGNGLYNQVKGTTITGSFVEGNIDFLKAKGSAENIYYAAEENGALIGVNRSTSDVIDVYFKDRKPDKVVLRNNLQGTISPIRQVNNSEMRIRGFKWLEDKRPKTKFDLFGN